jgi:hypothetical protein
VRYGWDGQDRLRVAERFTTWNHGEVILGTQEILTFAFSAGGDHLSINRDRRPDGRPQTKLRSITRRIVEDGRLTGLVTTSSPDSFQAPPLWVREAFEFDERGLICGMTTYRDRGEDHFDVLCGEPQRSIIRWEAVHDEFGALVRLYRHEFDDTGEAVTDRRVTWQRTSADELRAAEEAIERLLPEAVKDWVARCAPAGPAYCLGILYGDTWSPSLGIGTLDDLEAWGPPGSAGRADRLWNPAEFPCFDPEPAELNTPELAEAYRVTAQQWGSATPDKIRAKCLAAASELEIDQLSLSRADHCLIYAIDLELVDLEANLRKLGQTRTRRAIEKQRTA